MKSEFIVGVLLSSCAATKTNYQRSIVGEFSGESGVYYKMRLELKGDNTFFMDWNAGLGGNWRIIYGNYILLRVNKISNPSWHGLASGDIFAGEIIGEIVNKNRIQLWGYGVQSRVGFSGSSNPNPRMTTRKITAENSDFWREIQPA